MRGDILKVRLPANTVEYPDDADEMPVAPVGRKGEERIGTRGLGFDAVHRSFSKCSEDAKKKRKDKWLFTKRGEPWFCIAGIWRNTADVGEAFTMLTMPPGADIAPCHDRQIAILDRTHWAGWLDPLVPARSSLKPLPAGTLVFRHRHLNPEWRRI